MPYSLIGNQVKLIYTAETVKIYHQHKQSGHMAGIAQVRLFYPEATSTSQSTMGITIGSVNTLLKELRRIEAIAELASRRASHRTALPGASLQKLRRCTLARKEIRQGTLGKSLWAGLVIPGYFLSLDLYDSGKRTRPAAT